MKPTRPPSSLLLFALFTVVGLLFSTSYTFDDLARARPGTGPTRFVEELTGSYSAFVLFFGIRWIARRLGPSRVGWARALPVAALAALAYTTAHTSLMAVSRAVIFPLAGLGPYDYGNMLFRFPMEAGKDVLYFAIMYGGVEFIGRLERGRAAEVAAADLAAKLAAATLENLRLQLHPHFLFNTLNAISAVMYEDVGAADRMLAQLSDFLRVVLESRGAECVALADEMAAEQMYIDIMRARLERPLSLGIDIAADATGISIPLLLLQPLIENSIRHGPSPDGRALEIAIDVRRSNDTAHIDVVDNGAGYAPSAYRGHGLRNVEERLRHTFGPRASFAIRAHPRGGTHVALSYPVTG